MKEFKKFEEFIEESVSTETINEIKVFGKDLKDFNQYKSDLKSKINNFLSIIKKENRDTKEAFIKLINSIKTGKKLSKEEKNDIGDQLKDALKLSGFVAASILPGGFIYILLANIPSLKKYMIPSSFL